jgi:hypothetical protein
MHLNNVLKFALMFNIIFSYESFKPQLFPLKDIHKE